jgi:NADH-quinone oxidoreductase subunit M
MPTATVTLLVPCVLAIPLAGAFLVAWLGSARASAIRWVSLATTLIDVALVAIITWHFASAPADSLFAIGDPQTGVKTFEPQLATAWQLIPLGEGSSGGIEFFIGVDGLNVWLLVLTALLMVTAVLISWTSIQERLPEYYAWLLLLETGMLGVFLAFDIVLFYAFFELTLVPLFFLIGIWGGPQRRYAARKFLIYTFAGSLITLLGVLAAVVACYSRTGELTFSIPRLVELIQIRLNLDSPAEKMYWLSIPEVDKIFRWTIGTLDPAEADGIFGGVEFWIFMALMVGFAIKVPLVPLHTWLPLAHVEAPTAGSVLLAGVLLKIGAYGFLRLCLPLAPDAAVTQGIPIIGTLAVIGIVYGALCALAQDDIKKLVAYSSVSHLGFCMLGMFALNLTGLAGSLLQMINHGLSTGALFLLVGMLYERYHTRLMGDYGGMAARLKLLACFMVFFCLTSIGLPGLNGFVGEVLVLMGVFEMEWVRREWPALAAVGATGIVLGAWYLLTLLQRVFFGPVKEPPAGGHGDHPERVRDLGGRELAALVPIALACVALGVYPQPVLDSAKRDLRVVAHLVARAQHRNEPFVPPERFRDIPRPPATGRQGGRR